MTLFDLLFEFYTFEDLLNTACKVLGVSNPVLLGLSYFTVLIYSARTPSISPLS